ncbi:MAG: beta-galactosidase, partial [Lentisphaeria bacterium]|nr:beta-galactosidase [Lentisphaeria bacterium]
AVRGIELDRFSDPFSGSHDVRHCMVNARFCGGETGADYRDAAKLSLILLLVNQLPADVAMAGNSCDITWISATSSAIPAPIPAACGSLSRPLLAFSATRGTFPKTTPQHPMFHYGTNYWRPPNPPRNEHRLHLNKIRNELGFDLVYLRLLWNWHNRRPGEFLFDEVHEMFEICRGAGLSVIIQLDLESAPYWLESQVPESRYVSANGHAVELGAQEAKPSGGHPGLCFHHEAVVQAAEQYMRRVIAEFRGYDNLFGVDAWNEPHNEPAWCNNMWGNAGDKLFCYCEGSRAAFRAWLQERYGTVEVFNDTWGRAYTDFAQVQPPVLGGTYADWLDWMRFWHVELQANMRWRVTTIKDAAPGTTVLSHSGAVPPTIPRANAMINNFKFAAEVDMWGTSFAPQAFGWNTATCAQIMELTRSAARGKPYWISEMPGGPSNIRGFRASRIPRPKDYYKWNWLGAALGSSGTMHWCYLQERTGQEGGRFGMIRQNGEHTERSRAIARTCALLKAHGEIIANATTPTQVAVLYDPDNSSLLYGMELDDFLYGESHNGYYHAVWAADLTARYVTYEHLADIREPVLIVPMAMTMPEDVADAIAAFVEAGGVLITDGLTGMFDERGWLRPTIPAGKLAAAAGVVEGEMIYSDPTNDLTVPTADGEIREEISANLIPLDPIHCGPPITFSWPIDAVIPVHSYLIPLELRGARAIGRYEDVVLAAHHQYGQGQVYYFGTYMGLALSKNVTDAHRLLAAILQQHATPVVRGERLRPRLVTAGDRALLTVFNDDLQETVTEPIPLPADFTQAQDIADGSDVAVADGAASVTVAADAATVLLLS